MPIIDDKDGSINIRIKGGGPTYLHPGNYYKFDYLQVASYIKGGCIRLCNDLRCKISNVERDGEFLKWCKAFTSLGVVHEKFENRFSLAYLEENEKYLQLHPGLVERTNSFPGYVCTLCRRWRRRKGHYAWEPSKLDCLRCPLSIHEIEPEILWTKAKKWVTMMKPNEKFEETCKRLRKFPEIKRSLPPFVFRRILGTTQEELQTIFETSHPIKCKCAFLLYGKMDEDDYFAWEKEKSKKMEEEECITFFGEDDDGDY